MSETSSQAIQTNLLRLFERATEGRLSAGDLKKKLAPGSKKAPAAGLDEPGADRALAGLIEEGLLVTSGGAKDAHHPRPKASYRLTDKGRDQLRPTKPEVADSQLKAQEAFILLLVFRAEMSPTQSGKTSLTRSELNGKLQTKAATEQLEFDVKAAPETVAYHLATLVDKGCLVEEKRGASVGYRLEPEKGPRALASATQHDAVSFTMNGHTLNTLLAFARKSDPAATKTEPDESLEIGEAPDIEPAPEAPPVGPREIEKYVAHLRSGPYAGKDLIPIHEVRRLVAEHHGAEAAGHPAFDPLLMEMRSEDQLELIAISDNRRATSQQLDDSIPGVNETIFYIVVQ